MKIVEKPSPNFNPGRRGYQPEAIVIHIMEGTLPGTDNWFGNTQSKVSAHYGIGLDGAVHRYVQEKDTAWHAGRIDKPSWKLIKRTSGNLLVNPNYYTIGIEHEGNANSDWTDAMYQGSAELFAAISSRWNIKLDRDHIVGHHEIYSVKTCPGFKVDISKLIDLAVNPTSGTKTSYRKVMTNGQAITTVSLNIRSLPGTSLPPLRSVAPGVLLSYVGYTDEGETVHGNSTWYLDSSNHWFWSGGVKHLQPS